jgi:hypothetical protein
MELTDGDRLIIVMLTDIYKQLGIEDALDPEFIRAAVEDGQTWALKVRYPGVFATQDTPDDVVNEVARS